MYGQSSSFGTIPTGFAGADTGGGFGGCNPPFVQNRCFFGTQFYTDSTHSLNRPKADSYSLTKPPFLKSWIRPWFGYETRGGGGGGGGRRSCVCPLCYKVARPPLRPDHAPLRACSDYKMKMYKSSSLLVRLFRVQLFI